METRIEQEINRIVIVLNECKRQGLYRLSWPTPGPEVMARLHILGYEIHHVEDWGSAYVLICWR